MGVELVKSKGRMKSGRLTCEVCGTVSKVYQGSSPAAPYLTICERACEEDGWVFTVGFFSMLIGPQTMCKECAIDGKREDDGNSADGTREPGGAAKD